MKKKCDSYRTERKLIYGYYPLDEGVCWGTKEKEPCSCDGDMAKCDFYSEVREKGKENISIQDAINHFKYGISHDIFSEPVTTYAKLAVKALEKQLGEK